MPLKLKLWLGRITDWDKDAVRLLLLILVINLAIFGAIAINQAWPLGRSNDCNAECKAEFERLVDRLVEQHFKDPDRIIDDAIRDAR